MIQTLIDIENRTRPIERFSFQATEVMKEELLIAKRKKSTLLAEVRYGLKRFFSSPSICEFPTGLCKSCKLSSHDCLFTCRFLRHRYEFLKNQSLNSQPKHGLEPPQNHEIRPPNAKKEKSSQKREASLKLLAEVQAQDLNQRGGIYDGMEAASRKSRLVFHMNQKPRMCSDNEVSMHNSSPIFNHKEILYRVHEAAADRNMTPVFDLNQISVNIAFILISYIEKRRLSLLLSVL